RMSPGHPALPNSPARVHPQTRGDQAARAQTPGPPFLALGYVCFGWKADLSTRSVAIFGDDAVIFAHASPEMRIVPFPEHGAILIVEERQEGVAFAANH